MWLLVIILYGVLVIYEFIPLYKQKLWIDFWANGVLTLISFTIAMTLSLGTKIPSPITSFGKSLSSMFGR